MFEDFFDDETEPIVKPEAFYGKQKFVADKCLIMFSKEIHDYILTHCKCEEVAALSHCNGRIPIYCMEHKGEKICFYLSGIGSSAAAKCCYDVHWQTGATIFIMFGSCGSLDSESTRGKFVIPSQAYRGEGTSYYYAPSADYIDIKTCDALADIFDSLKVPYVKSRVWTTDCMYRETKGLVAKRKSEGCIAVEMELAGVQALCDFYGLTLYDFLEAGDVLSEAEYDASELRGANHNVAKLFIALDVALRAIAM